MVIGVHSAKFPSEKETENVRQAVMRHGIEHPVINDRGFRIWNDYGIHAWPTVVLIDPNGKVVGMKPGEIDADEYIPLIDSILERNADRIDRSPLPVGSEKSLERERLLSFPSKLLLADERLFIADTGHHRILELRLGEGTDAEILRIFGSGAEGFDNGHYENASFRDPHGMALEGSSLYVADTGNHAIRAVDLEGGYVRTVAGTGEKGSWRLQVGRAREVALRSPWALQVTDAETLLVALAGSHQIGLLLHEEQIGPFAGSGQEALVDGPRETAGFNQPSDIAFGMDHVFVADSEASAIRAIVLDEPLRVMTMVGQGLFEFGDVDGTGAEVRLQHPTGIALGEDGQIYIADSYNHKIKVLDPATGRTTSLIGSGRAGDRDGPFDEVELREPEGVVERGGVLYIADTNNHAIRVADLAARTVRTLEIRG